MSPAYIKHTHMRKTANNLIDAVSPVGVPYKNAWSTSPKQTARDTRPWYMRKFPVAAAVVAPQINIARAKFGKWYDGLKTDIKTRYEEELRDAHNRIEFTKGIGRRLFADLNQAAGTVVYGLGMIPTAAYGHITYGSRNRPLGDYRSFDWALKQFRDHYDYWEDWGNKPGNYVGLAPEDAKSRDSIRGPISAGINFLTSFGTVPKTLSAAAKASNMPKFFHNADNVRKVLQWDEAFSYPGLGVHVADAVYR